MSTSSDVSPSDGEGVFISYKSDDRDLVGRIYEDLRQRGVKNIWMDKQELRAGELWEQQIGEAIRTRSHMIVCLSPKALESNEVRKEYVKADELGLAVIPVLLYDVTPEDLPPILKSRHLLNLSNIGHDAVIFELSTGEILPKVDYILPEFCQVPAGVFQTGPSHRLTDSTIDKDFWISKTAITLSEYVCFVRAGGYKDDTYWAGDNRKAWSNSPNASWIMSGDFETYAEQYPCRPVHGLSWYEALAYARWLGYMISRPDFFQLPSNEEWEKAARGTDGRAYPWGMDWQDGLANTEELGLGVIRDVGQCPPESVSPYGCQDMAGNIWEWTRSSEIPGHLVQQQMNIPRIIRGGSYKHNRSNAMLFRQISQDPIPMADSFKDTIGIRLVYYTETQLDSQLPCM